jgi:acetyltransferase-like isoleucine patch superfamily enzyme
MLRRPATAVVHWAWDWAGDVGAIGPDDARGRRFGALGAGSVLAFPQGALYNERYVRIGRGTMIGPYASVTAGMAPGQEMASDPVVRIGDRCVIGRGSHVIGHWSIELGDDIQTGPYVYITDQNHSYLDPEEPIGRQWPVEAGVRIGSGSWLGANVVVLPGSHIGEHVVVAAGAVVRGELPDRCVAAGVPARVVRRWTSEEGWVDTGHGAPSGAR